MSMRLAGYECLFAESGREALDLLDTNDVDLVLTDLWMDDMDGYGLTKAIKLRPSLRHLPVIALTTDRTPEQHDRLRRAGALAVIYKPFKMPELVAAVVRALGPDSTSSGA